MGQNHRGQTHSLPVYSVVEGGDSTNDGFQLSIKPSSFHFHQRDLFVNGGNEQATTFVGQFVVAYFVVWNGHAHK